MYKGNSTEMENRNNMSLLSIQTVVVNGHFLYRNFCYVCAHSLDVLYLIMCGNPFSNEYVARLLQRHSGKGVRSLNGINVCLT